MAQQNIYPIQLLNDIHNYFPDILYNPGRFRNVQDLLDYFRSVADINPYTRGLDTYHNRRVSNRRPNTTRPTQLMPPPIEQVLSITPTTIEYISDHTNVAPVAPVATLAATLASAIASPVPAPQVSTAQPVRITSTAPPRTTIFEDNFVPLYTTQTHVPLNNYSALMTTIFNNILGEGGLQPFLEQSVIVHPTAQEINNATTTYTTSRNYDDICTICQDSIDISQEVRRLNHCRHYFHKECIDAWFRRNVHCPTCRHDIRETAENTTGSPISHISSNISNT